MSLIAWLDTSPEEQRRVRELVGLFAQRDSRDELGIGQVRDAFSEALFPGTSTLQTRARYFLFVPWIFRTLEGRGYHGPDLQRRGHREERKLIAALRDAGDTEGLIGRVAGPTVKLLPSTIYWYGLRRWGILLAPGSTAELGRPGSHAGDQADELAERVVGTWHPGLPEAPEGFPGTSDGLSLRPVEAEWLRERVLDRCAGTLLAHLVASPTPLTNGTTAPWEEPHSHTADDTRALLNHAELFSLVIQGASLLYNLALGERYEQAGLTRLEEPVEQYRDLLSDWAYEVEEAGPRLAAWDTDAMWDFVYEANPRIAPTTRPFVNRWIDAARDGQAASLADDPTLRNAIVARERHMKRAQSRFTNERLLRAWSGASGTARFDFRWRTVGRIVGDILEGSGIGDAGT